MRSAVLLALQRHLLRTNSLQMQSSFCTAKTCQFSSQCSGERKPSLLVSHYQSSFLHQDFAGIASRTYSSVQRLGKDKNNTSLQLLQRLSENTSIVHTATRNLMDYSEYKKLIDHDTETVLKRFRRLGNGLWIRKQTGAKSKTWLNIFKKGGPQKVYRKRRTVICNSKQSKELDRRVPPKWKRQKWYVEDPYQGYTEESLFHYHPATLSGNSTSRSNHHRAYAWSRAKRGNRLRKLRARAHQKVVKTHRQKVFSMSKASIFV